MNLFKGPSKITLPILIVSISLAVISCENPAAAEEEHEHLPVGAVLFLNGQEIARYENSNVTGQITIQEDEETALITIRFIAEDGDLFQPHEPEYSLRFEVANTAIAEAEQDPADGKWQFRVVGKSSGSTSVTLQLFHGTHSDLVIPAIPIIVNAN